MSKISVHILYANPKNKEFIIPLLFHCLVFWVLISEMHQHYIDSIRPIRKTETTQTKALFMTNKKSTHFKDQFSKGQASKKRKKPKKSQCESFIAAMFFALLSILFFDMFYSIIMWHNFRVPLSL